MNCLFCWNRAKRPCHSLQLGSFRSHISTTDAVSLNGISKSKEETLVSLLKKCSCMKVLEQILAHAIQLGFEQSLLWQARSLCFVLLQSMEIWAMLFRFLKRLRTQMLLFGIQWLGVSAKLMTLQKHLSSIRECKREVWWQTISLSRSCLRSVGS